MKNEERERSGDRAYKKREEMENIHVLLYIVNIIYFVS